MTALLIINSLADSSSQNWKRFGQLFWGEFSRILEHREGRLVTLPLRLVNWTCGSRKRSGMLKTTVFSTFSMRLSFFPPVLRSSFSLPLSHFLFKLFLLPLIVRRFRFYSSFPFLLISFYSYPPLCFIALWSFQIVSIAGGSTLVQSGIGPCWPYPVPCLLPYPMIKMKLGGIDESKDERNHRTKTKKKNEKCQSKGSRNLCHTGFHEERSKCANAQTAAFVLAATQRCSI